MLPLLILLLQCLETRGPWQRDKDAVELFSGEKAITNGACKAGLVALGYDKTYTKKEKNLWRRKGF